MWRPGNKRCSHSSPWLLEAEHADPAIPIIKVRAVVERIASLVLRLRTLLTRYAAQLLDFAAKSVVLLAQVT